ncbi:MAG: 30S ribosomal protein S7 [Planctomycetota bacterium]
MPRPRRSKKIKEKKTKFKFKSTERFLKGDPIHGNLVVSKFINQIMLDGKKTVAQKIVYSAIDMLGKRVEGQEPLDAFLSAIDNVKPNIEVRSKRVGGATYQVPIEITRKRQQALAIRVIVGNTRGRKGKPVAQSLADELHDAFQRQGASIQWRENTHKMAEANKLFAHFAW